MTTTPITPPIQPPAQSNGNVPLPQAPAENVVVIGEEGEPHSIADNEDRWAELGEQLTDVFKSRAVEPSTETAPESAGVTPTVEPPAGTEPAPAEPAPSTVTTPPAEPPSTDGVPAPAAMESVQQVPDFDPFQVPGQPPLVAPQAAQPVPAEPQAVARTAPLPPGHVDFLGTPVPLPVAQQMRDTYAWAQSLTPEESNAINEFIRQNRTQQQQPAPAAYPTGAVPPQPQPAAYPNPNPAQYTPQPVGFAPGQQVAPPPPLDPSTIDDPAIAAYLNQQNQFLAFQQQQLAAQQAAIEQTNQAVMSQQQQQAQQQQAAQAVSIEQAKWDFALRYNLSTAELDIAETRLAGSNLLPSLLERRQGDVYQSILDGFETVVWTSPDFRQRLVSQEAAPAIEEANAIRQRAASLGALGGSGGSIARNDTPPASPQDRHKAMVEAISAGMNQNPS